MDLLLLCFADGHKRGLGLFDAYISSIKEKIWKKKRATLKINAWHTYI